MKIDLKDKKIMNELHLNCRQSSRQIGKKVGLSREVVDYRIKKLEKQGVIRGYITLVDSEMLGFTPYTVLLTLKNIKSGKKAEIIRKIAANNSVKWVAQCSGKWDIYITFVARSKEGINKSLNTIIEASEGHAQGYDILMPVKRYKEASLPFGEDSEKTNPEAGSRIADEKDISIIGMLASNARMNIVDIAGSIGLTPEAAGYRIKNLVSSGIIKSFTAVFDMKKLGYLWHLLVFDVSHIDERYERSFSTFIQNKKSIHFAERNIGRWKITIELFTKDQQELDDILGEIKDFLSAIQEGYEILIIQGFLKQVSFVECMN